MALLITLALQAVPAAGQGRVIHEGDTVTREVPPHHGTGMSTAYRISDQMPNRSMEFRKRVMHPGASIGMHVIAHDEVYYVVGGTGELTVDGRVSTVRAGDAAYLYDGNDVGIRQTGDDDLVLLIAYPLRERAE
ncbi:cupin domain-containing protein [Stakelama saccharophila]|uniref:Cupin domain-containing protein n=2 Tax=Stakelama saccharophila TaxID=3075605 RepID=A0ABZ0BCW1_9SPHN|nr:cupin domain-containing protein [Stakelama sp. W311]WNO55129.1 cupin domain-containing protein [Stakelama sp. W311]